MKIAKPVALILIACVHVYAFTHVWAMLGAKANFAVFGATGSSILAALVAAFVTATIATSPLALLAGFIGGKRFIAAAVVLLLVAWAVFYLYARGMYGTLSMSLPFSLLAELVAMATFGTVFAQFGARAVALRAGA